MIFSLIYELKHEYCLYNITKTINLSANVQAWGIKRFNEIIFTANERKMYEKKYFIYNRIIRSYCLFLNFYSSSNIFCYSQFFVKVIIVYYTLITRINMKLDHFGVNTWDYFKLLT